MYHAVREYTDTDLARPGRKPGDTDIACADNTFSDVEEGNILSVLRTGEACKQSRLLLDMHNMC